MTSHRKSISKQKRLKIIIWVIVILSVIVLLVGLQDENLYTRQPTGDVVFCGGFAGIQCPSGQTCKLRGDYPDAQGKCIEIIEANRRSCPDDKPYFTQEGCSVNEPPICPQVCIPMYEIKNDACVLNNCGSGCGPNGVTTFETLVKCNNKLWLFKK